MSTLDLRIPPLVLVAVASLVMWLIAGHLPETSFAVRGQDLAATVIAALGLFICVAGVLEFRRARTTVNPMDPVAASSLVVRGVYRYSRNPMYLGFALVLTGWAVFLGSALSLLVVAAFIGYLNKFQIEPEERAMRARFGAQFHEYRSRVRRWV